MAVPAAVWCVMCGAMPDVALTIERDGVMAHYGACWDHVTAVAARARRETSRAHERPLSGPQAGARHPGAIEAQAIEEGDEYLGWGDEERQG